jgi:hypothetical protein
MQLGVGRSSGVHYLQQGVCLNGALGFSFLRRFRTQNEFVGKGPKRRPEGG